MTSRTGSTLSTLRVRSRGGSDPVAPNTDSTAGWWRWSSANKPMYKSLAARSPPITTAMRLRTPDGVGDLGSRNSTTGALGDEPPSRSAIGGTSREGSVALSPSAMRWRLLARHHLPQLPLSASCIGWAKSELHNVAANRSRTILPTRRCTSNAWAPARRTSSLRCARLCAVCSPYSATYYLKFDISVAFRQHLFGK